MSEPTHYTSADKIFNLANELGKAVKQIDQLTKERNELRANVSKCLKELGEENKFKCNAIDRAEQAEAKCAEMGGVLETIIASTIHPDVAVRAVIVPLDPIRNALSTDCGTGWLSPEDYAQLEAKCAEMRALLELVWEDNPRFEHALSTDCGTGWLSPEKVKVLLTAISDCIYCLSDHRDTYPNVIERAKKARSEAIAATATEEGK